MDMIKAAIKSNQDRTGIDVNGLKFAPNGYWLCTDSHLCSWAPQDGRGPDPASQEDSLERPAGRSNCLVKKIRERGKLLLKYMKY